MRYRKLLDQYRAEHQPEQFSSYTAWRVVLILLLLVSITIVP